MTTETRPCLWCDCQIEVKNGGMAHPEIDGPDCPMGGKAWSLGFYDYEKAKLERIAGYPSDKSFEARLNRMGYWAHLLWIVPIGFIVWQIARIGYE